MSVIKESTNAVPTRQCLVCERLENPVATIVHGGVAWLCPECKSRIKRLIYNNGVEVDE